MRGIEAGKSLPYVSRRRMPALPRFFGADGLRELPVHPQRSHRSPACGCEPEHTAAFPLKMLRPHLLARVKNRSGFPRRRVGRSPARAFTERTGDAGEREVFGGSRAVFRQRVDVIHMKPCLLHGSRKTAVFATTARALKHRAFQRERHAHAAAAGALDARSFSSESISVSSTSPSASRRSRGVSGAP